MCTSAHYLNNIPLVVFTDTLTYIMKLFPTKLSKFKKAMSNAKTIDNTIEDFINYYNNYSVIKNKKEPDDDMLLFQFGSYDWDGSSEKFEINLTRQFLGKNDEFIQFSYTAKFNPKEFESLGSFSSWSIDEDNIEKWISSIKTQEFYNKIKDLKIVDKEICQEET